MTARPTTLILGWGNPGRLDDGLGPAFIDAIAAALPPDVAASSDYQLTIEDAADVAGHQRVLFVDADRVGSGPFRLERVLPSRLSPSFSTHSVSPGAVLSLSLDLFQAEPEAWLLGIRGYAFDAFGERLTDRARANLVRAVEHVRSAIDGAGFRKVCGHEDPPCPTPSA